MASATAVHVFQYSDYRLYLRDYYTAQKAKSSAFSPEVMRMRRFVN